MYSCPRGETSVCGLSIGEHKSAGVKGEKTGALVMRDVSCEERADGLSWKPNPCVLEGRMGVVNATVSQ